MATPLTLDDGQTRHARADGVAAANANATRECLSPLDFAVSYALKRPGKCIRSRLLLALSQMEGSASPGVFAAAEAIELIHTATLVHDDIIDQSETRRGQASVCRAFGLSTAYDVGVDLLGQGVSTLARACSGLVEADALGSFLQRLAYGQILESLPVAGAPEKQYQRLQSITDGKTGALFALASRVGLMLSTTTTVGELRIAAADAFAFSVGRAFQMKDDLLDLQSDPSRIRARRTDIQQGVLSWPLFFWAQAQPVWTEAVNALTAASTSAEAALRLRQQILESGAVEISQNRLRFELEQARFFARTIHPSVEPAIGGILALIEDGACQ